VFTFVSLATFTPKDLATFSLPAERPMHNGGGAVGAQLAAFLLEGLGVCAYLLVCLVAAWAVLNLLGRGAEQLAVRVCGAILLMACGCTLANASGGVSEIAPGPGGVVGVTVGGLLQQYFGHTGQWLLGAGVTMMALLMLSVDELLTPPLVWVGRTGANRIAPLLRRRKARRMPARTAETSPAPVADSEAHRTPWGTEDERGATPRPAAPTLGAVGHDEADGTPSGEATQTVEGATEEGTERPTGSSEEGIDTGRPLTAGYLDKIVQGGTPAPADAGATEDEGPTEESAEATAEHEEAPPTPRKRARDANYILPPPSLLDEPKIIDKSLRGQHIQDQIEVLERTLKEFGVGARVVDIDQGPVVTRYELALEAGTKLTKVTSLSDDLAIATKAPAVRIVAPIPGKSTVGVELPNMDKELVRLRELSECDSYRKRDYVIPILLGKDASGKPIVSDLTRMPHLLIAGATGSGKSVCINSVIASILMTQHPDDVRLILIDPKMVELAIFAEIPHLLTPVVVDMKRATWILDWATKKMDERYDTLAAVGVRSIAAYNRLGEEEIRRRLGEDVDYERVPFHLPYIVIIVDELADMMMLASKNIETSITRLAQKSRAVGLHIILATQRPSVDVITGLIKSNLPTRISFQVTSKVDSRTILDRNGAEKLLGCGDLLYLPPGSSNLLRAQGTFVSDEELHRIVDFVKRQAKPDFNLNLDGCTTDVDDGEASEREAFGPDELYEDACRIVLASGRGSVSLLQRKLEIGYTRAARLVDMMAAEGIVGDYKGSKAREVVMGLDEWEGRRGTRLGGAPPQAAPTLDEHYENLDDAAEDDE
jgi:S-DNA-T family DNA segregation ATPase FtsK/SpoIIIE